MFYKKRMAAVAAACFIVSISASVMAAPVATQVVPAKTAVTVKQDTRASQQELAQQAKLGILWMRSSAEYRSLCYQAYNTATTQVDKALADPARKGKPLAIVLDCDETVVDNIGGMAKSVSEGDGLYSLDPWWSNWIREARAGAMPGAADFLNGVHQKGVSIFYVTNRFAKIDDTLRNLKALNFPSADKEHVLLMCDNGNKQSRFDKVTANYDVVIYMGDNSGDLPIHTYGKNAAERNAIIDQHKADFGTRFIVFPNPAYGSWVDAMAKNYLSLSPQERERVNKEILLKK
jgi:5'-nucleotidase (lipoprotein e(P4) family)